MRNFTFRNILIITFISLLIACGGAYEKANKINSIQSTKCPKTALTGTAIFNCEMGTDKTQISTIPPNSPPSLVKLNGVLRNFFLRPTFTGLEITDMIGNQGVIIIPEGTNFVEFDDLNINLTIAAELQSIPYATYRSLIELYIAYFNRVPDANGLQYWIKRYKSGMSLSQIGESFYTAAIEYSSLTGYSADMSNTNFVEIIYKNVFARETVDVDGLKYWVDQLNNGISTRGTLIQNMLYSARTYYGDATYGWVVQLLDDKFYIADSFASANGLNFNTNEDSIKNGKLLMSLVTRKDSRDQANVAIQSYLGSYRAPVADLGASLITLVGNSVSISGDSSYDQEGKPLNYIWSLKSKPENSHLSISTTNINNIDFIPDVIGNYEVNLVVNNGKLSSTPTQMTVIAENNLSKENTVVIRTVGTSPAWGQEPAPGWHHAMPIKDAPGFSAYDLEIGKNSQSQTTYIKLYKFDNSNPNYQDIRPYMNSKLLLTIDLSSPGSSTQLLDAIKVAFEKIFAKETPTRVVLAYSGHGGPTTFFEGALNIPDAQNLLISLKKSVGNLPVILDFSTNCNTGFFDFVVKFYSSADYLIASDLSVGGFSGSNIEFNLYLKYLHDQNLHKFWSQDHSTLAALKTILSSRQNFWHAVETPLTTAKVQQSLSTFDLTKFTSFMKALKADKNFIPNQSLFNYSQDIGTYVANQSNSELKNSFNTFQIGYSSNRNMFLWKNNTKGFSVLNNQSLNLFLNTMQ